MHPTIFNHKGIRMSVEHMPNILFDHGRTARIGMPEDVFCQGKSRDALYTLLSEYGRDKARPILFTRLEPEVFGSRPEGHRSAYEYHALSRNAFTPRMP